MSSSLLLVVFIVVFASLPEAQCCHTFNDTKITVRSRTGEYLETSVTGCLERKTFDVTVAEIYVKGQQISTLRRDDVRHLVRLTSISFEECRITAVEPALFRNVPRLKSIKIASNDLVEIKSGIFTSLPSLETLTLDNNDIDSIEDDAFGNSTTLKEVHCSHNLLGEWKEAWFGNSTGVEVMDFRFNRIRTLSSFGRFVRLKELRFDYNELEVVRSGAFEGLKKLRYLGLRYNRLVSIDWAVFPEDFHVGTLSIGANYLNYLSVKELERIRVREMEVEGNPWTCPCLDQIYKWLYETNATLIRMKDACDGRQIPVCSFSSPPDDKVCSEKIDREVTHYYLTKLQEIEPPLNKFCARLDSQSETFEEY